ncbi:hypothetical protein GE21DRAFT_1126033 [Neurospora crassa]|nr:hypothetical protein GE21DRAFT_1126033 [Neurospora crassa]
MRKVQIDDAIMDIISLSLLSFFLSLGRVRRLKISGGKNTTTTHGPFSFRHLPLSQVSDPQFFAGGIRYSFVISLFCTLSEPTIHPFPSVLLLLRSLEKRKEKKVRKARLFEAC